MFLVFLYLFLFIFLLIILLIIHYLDGTRYIELENYDIFQLDKEYKRKKKKIENCIISLTTTPGRISKIRPTLISLLDQSVTVEEIRLNVPYKSCKGVDYKIPKWLKKLKNVKIYRDFKDWGPATKLIPTLLDCKNEANKNKTNKKIIVVDDDVIYGQYTIEQLNFYYEKYNMKTKDGQKIRKKRKTAITMYGDVINEKKDTENGLPTRIINYVTGENYTDVLRGHSGYLVTPDMFTESLYDYTKVPKECFFVDDNYFSGHLRQNNVKILMVGLTYKGVPLPELTSCAIGALHREQNHNGHNERIVNAFLF